MTLRSMALPVVCLSALLAGCGKPEPPPAPKPIQECKDPAVLERVKGILSTQLDYPLEDLKPDMRLKEDLHIGGPTRIQLRMDFETAFGIKIFEEEIEKARTISELAAFVDEKQKKK